MTRYFHVKLGSISDNLGGANDEEFVPYLLDPVRILVIIYTYMREGKPVLRKS